MSGERHAIAHPLFLDFSNQPAPPLKFVLQSSYSPIGDVERTAPGVTASRTDWYTEVAVELTGIDAVAVVYLIPLGSDFGVMAASMDTSFEAFFQLASGDDHGDGVTKLVAQHWPEVYEMLARSSRNMIDGRILGNVITQDRVARWVVAEPVRDGEVGNISSDHILDFIKTTVNTSLLATDPVRLVEHLPGLLQVLAGPDRMTRRLNALSALLGAPKGFAGILEGGIDPSEWIKLGGEVLDAVDNMRKLKD